MTSVDLWKGRIEEWYHAPSQDTTVHNYLNFLANTIVNDLYDLNIISSGLYAALEDKKYNKMFNEVRAQFGRLDYLPGVAGYPNSFTHTCGSPPMTPTYTSNNVVINSKYSITKEDDLC